MDHKIPSHSGMVNGNFLMEVGQLLFALYLRLVISRCCIIICVDEPSPIFHLVQCYPSPFLPP